MFSVIGLIFEMLATQRLRAEYVASSNYNVK